MERDQEAAEFWQQKEQETGAPIIYRSFSILLGNSHKGKVDLSGLIYISAGSLFFEDFEKQDPISWLVKRKKSTYEKYCFSFPLEELEFCRAVSEREAYRALKGSIRPEETKVFHPLLSLGSRRVCHISLKNRENYFFEILDHKGFLSHIPAGKMRT